MIKRLIALLLCAVCIFGAYPCSALQLPDEDLADKAGMGAEWYIVALHQSGAEYDYAAYRRALAEYMANADSAGAVTKQKLALAMLAAGGYDERTAAVPDETIGKQGIMSLVFGLHLLANGCESAHTIPELVDELLSLQLEDGGWALYGETADADVTAMVLQALAPHHTGDEVTRALELLSARQGEDGAYSSMGESNAESTAQVIIALCALGIDCRTDERFVKNGTSALDALGAFRCDGGYSHTVGGELSESATAQAMLADTALARFDAGKGSLYILDGGLPERGEIFVPQSRNVSYKVYACAAVLILGLCACVWMVRKKRPKKSFITIAACALALTALICATDIKSADDYYTAQPVDSPAGTVTLTVRCDTVIGLSDEEHIPQDGIILPEVTVEFSEGETVLDATVRAAREHEIQLDTQNGSYVRGIGYIYEFDFGDLSGWMCMVNGEKINVGASQYELSDGDVIEWMYTCEIGNDLNL